MKNKNFLNLLKILYFFAIFNSFVKWNGDGIVEGLRILPGNIL